MKKLFSVACILLALSSIGSCQHSKNKELTVGDTIPAFHLPDQNGRIFSSADHLGKTYLVIFFYPKDESMVCTKEACSFRDRYADIIKAGASVIGINGGSISSHKQFQQHDQLPYPLLSNSANLVLNSFGAHFPRFRADSNHFMVDLFLYPKRYKKPY